MKSPFVFIAIVFIGAPAFAHQWVDKMNCKSAADQIEVKATWRRGKTYDVILKEKGAVSYQGKGKLEMKDVFKDPILYDEQTLTLGDKGSVIALVPESGPGIEASPAGEKKAQVKTVESELKLKDRSVKVTCEISLAAVQGAAPDRPEK